MIDAYSHCGISKFLPIEAVEAVADEAGVAQAVLCQHLGEYDNSYLESVVRARPERFTAVALVDGLAEDWREALAAVAGSHAFRGLRVVDEALLANPDLAVAAASLGLVVVLYAPQGMGRLVLPVRRLLAACPTALIEITHLGNPRVEHGTLVSGRELLELASEPRVVVTLSGLSMFCPHPYAPLDELIVHTVEAFGAKRVLWGSNYPVAGADSSSYRRELDLIANGHWGLDATAVRAITHDNARRIWFEGDPA